MGFINSLTVKIQGIYKELTLNNWYFSSSEGITALLREHLLKRKNPIIKIGKLEFGYENRA